MDWRKMFKGKNYNKDMVIGAFMGMIETTKVVINFSKAQGNEEYVKTFTKVLNNLQKDLEEIQNEKDFV